MTLMEQEIRATATRMGYVLSRDDTEDVWAWISNVFHILRRRNYRGPWSDAAMNGIFTEGVRAIKGRE